MKTKLLAAAAIVAFGLTATSALASNTITQNGESVTITATATPFTPTLTGGANYFMIDDFDSAPAAGFVASASPFITSGSTDGVAAEPLGDATKYLAIQGGTSFTLTDTLGSLGAISFYMGSPDGNTEGTGSPQNNLTLTVNGALGPIVLHGPDIWGGPSVNPGNGQQGTGFLITYVFAPNSVHSVTFTETGSSAFEIDNVSGVAVPEPASWALMIMGFGMAGGLMRAKRRQAATA
jgi:hypothetical protein